MKKRLIKFNEHAHNKELKLAETDLVLYNKLIKDLQPYADTLKIKLDKQVLPDLLINPKEYAFDCIVGSNPLTIGGALVSKKKAMDLIDMPKDWLKIIKIIEAFNQVLEETPFHKAQAMDAHGTNRVDLKDMDFNKGVLALSDDFIAGLKDRHSVYTQNEKQNEAHDHLLKIYECFGKLKALGVGHVPDLESIGIEVTHGLGREPIVNFEPERVLRMLK